MDTVFQTPQPRQALAQGLSRPISDKSEGRTAQMLWLDKNEGTDPEYIEFIKKIIPEIPVTALYAYPDCYPLYRQLASLLQVEINQLLVAAGSDGIIRSVYEAFVSPGDIVIHPEPTFLMYSLYSKIYGSKPLVLNYEASSSGPVLLAETIINAIKESKPKLVCLPNPGSPTGTVFDSHQLHSIINMAGNVGAVILIDEAYYPFYNETTLPWINQYPHLVVSRSFSKAWGLAGIRLGYGAACNMLMTQLHKVRPRYEVGSLSAAIAERMLHYPEVMHASVNRLNKGKEYFLNEMRKLGFKTINAHGNFFHVAFDQYASQIHSALENNVLYQKDFKHPSLAGYSRFTTTTQELFAPVIDKIIKIVQHNQPG